MTAFLAIVVTILFVLAFTSGVYVALCAGALVALHVVWDVWVKP